MAKCVASARARGCFKEFVVFAENEIEGCVCYQVLEEQEKGGWDVLHYLKLGMRQRKFEYYIWIDPYSYFVRNLQGILSRLNGSPVHVPLLVPICEVENMDAGCNTSWGSLAALMKNRGIIDVPYVTADSFWIVKHEAVELLEEYAVGFRNDCRREEDLDISVAVGLGYAMQLLCGDPERHRLESTSDIWANYLLRQGNTELCAEERLWRHPIGGRELKVNPAIWHLG